MCVASTTMLHRVLSRNGNVGGDIVTWNRQGHFFKKLKSLRDGKTIKIRPVDTILDEAGNYCILQWEEDWLDHWKRLFEQVLNVENAVTADVLAEGGQN